MDIPIKKSSHCAYSLCYHLVLVVKYRRKCITDEIGAYLIEVAEGVLKQWGCELIEGKSDRDHLHLLLTLDQSHTIGDRVGSLKNTTSRMVRKKYGDQIKQYLWEDSFWSDGYFICTTGSAEVDVIKKYIEDQGKERKRGRPKKHSS